MELNTLNLDPDPEFLLIWIRIGIKGYVINFERNNVGEKHFLLKNKIIMASFA